MRGEEEGREGHGRGRGGQAGWHRDDGWSVQERAVTGPPHIYCTGAGRGVEKHGGRLHGVCGQVCGQIRNLTLKISAQISHISASIATVVSLLLKLQHAASFISASKWQQAEMLQYQEVILHNVNKHNMAHSCLITQPACEAFQQMIPERGERKKDQMLMSPVFSN